MRKRAVNQYLSDTRVQHRRSVIKQQNKKEEKKLNEFIQECSLYGQGNWTDFVVSEMYRISDLCKNWSFRCLDKTLNL